MPKENTLQIYLKSIHFDRAAARVMWVYVVSFVRRNSDGAVQMYASPTSFQIIRPPGRDKLVHEWNGAGAMVGTMPTENLDSVSLTTFLIRDRKKGRAFGEFLLETFKDDGDGSAVAGLVGSAVAAGAGPGAAIAATLLKITPPLARFIGKALRRRKDVLRIYGDGVIPFDEDEDFEDDVHLWSGHRGGDKGYFTTVWDFRDTHNPAAALRPIHLPEDLKKRLGDS